MSKLSELVVRPVRPADIGKFLRGLDLPSALTSYQSVYAGLSIDGAVVPGAPIPIVVNFWSYDHRIDFGTGCTFKVFLIGSDKHGTETKTEIFSAPAAAGTFIPYVADPSPMAMSIGEYHAVIDPIPSTGSLGKAIYEFGDHDLLLEVTANGKDQGPYSGQATLTVVPEAVDQSWWTWGDLRWRDGAYHSDAYWIDWKESYSLWGFCTNLSSADIGMDFNVTLQEIDDSGATKTIGASFASLPKNEGSPQLGFPSISQDWKWLEEVVWLVVGPLHRTFLYEAVIAITDEYGNQYSLLSAPLGLTVNVSDKKQQLAEAAAGTGFAAWFLTAVSIIVPWVGIAAGAVGTASQVLGAEALDPPSPDKKFMALVVPKPPSMAAALKTDPRLSGIGSFVSTVLEITSCMEALNAIEAKIMGARSASSTEGLKLQKASYRKIVRRMVKAAGSLHSAADQAGRSLAASGLLGSPELRNLALGRTRIPKAELAERLRKIGHSKKSVALVQELLSTPRLRKLLLSLDTNARQLDRSAVALAGAVFSIQREAGAKLRSYRTRKKGSKPRAR